MKWRVREVSRGAFQAQRRGGLFWVGCLTEYLPGYGLYAPTWNNEAAAIEEMEKDMADHAFRPRTVTQSDGYDHARAEVKR
jgi:hypothetical protein